MKNKPKFNPEITRVKLNPEQAVIECNCMSVGKVVSLKAITTRSACKTSSSKTIINAFCGNDSAAS